MREGVHAGRGGKVRRQVGGEFRIENDEFGEEAREKDDAAFLGPGKRDDGTAADFAAGSCGGGDANTAREAAPVILKIEPGELEIGLFDEQTAGLADVQRTATAKGHNRITAGSAK